MLPKGSRVSQAVTAGPVCLRDRALSSRPIAFFLFSKLFDLVYREETLLNVIKSVTRNGRSIILTAVLALILVYLFSIVGYLFFKDDFLLEVDRLPNDTALPGGSGGFRYKVFPSVTELKTTVPGATEVFPSHPERECCIQA